MDCVVFQLGFVWSSTHFLRLMGRKILFFCTAPSGAECMMFYFFNTNVMLLWEHFRFVCLKIKSEMNKILNKKQNLLTGKKRLLKYHTAVRNTALERAVYLSDRESVCQVSAVGAVQQRVSSTLNYYA